jgi:flavin-dependent dehydrogenase
MEIEKTCEAVIIGGGLAGLSAAIELASLGHQVVLIEKKKFPRHKVCGEYVSNEVLPVLTHFGIDPFAAGAQRMKRFLLSSPSGSSAESNLPLGAFSLSRYVLDELLYQKAIALGVTVITGTQATNLQTEKNHSTVYAGKMRISARFVIGAYGKSGHLRSPNSVSPDTRPGRYFAVKRHVRTDFPDDLVALHNFKGGYCGVSKIEDNKVNICYLAQSSDLNRFGGIVAFEQNIVYRNPHLKKIFENAEEVFSRPMAISNFTIGARKPVESGVFMAGDAAGMISPLCGNGMAMAITSGFKLARILHQCVIENLAASWAETEYSKFWKTQFSSRLFWGEMLQQIFGKPTISNVAISTLSLVPSLTPLLIERTHGDVVVA